MGFLSLCALVAKVSAKGEVIYRVLMFIVIFLGW